MPDYFFEPESEKDFISKLNMLLENRDLYDVCKLGCLKLAEDFDRQKLAENMLSILINTVKLPEGV